METIIEELILIISNEIEAFNQLLKTLHEKQRAIVEGEIDRLKKHVQVESNIAQQTKSLEAERISRTKELAEMLALDNLNPRLSEIIEKVEEKYAQRLSEQRELLRSSVQKIQNLNKSNQFLLNYSLQFIEDSMRLLLSGNNKLTVYQKNGKVEQEMSKNKILDHSI